MLLAIDVGNTDTKIGLWDGNIWAALHRFPTAEFSDRLTSEITGRASSAICASVVPEVNAGLEAALSSRGVKLRFLQASDDLRIEMRYKTPNTLGADRLANALAVLRLTRSVGIAVDFGTATKLEAVSDGHIYHGGAILAGLQMAARGLAVETAQLPGVELVPPERSIGDDTSSALRSGILHGHAAAVDGMVARFADELGTKPEVFATGGFANLIVPLCRTPMQIVSTLTLDGLIAADATLRDK